MANNRKDVLLRAAYDLLKRAKDMHYVEEATHITVWYDEAECDGYCLMEDIAIELNLDDDTDPLPILRLEADEGAPREPDAMTVAKADLESRGER